MVRLSLVVALFAAGCGSTATTSTDPTRTYGTAGLVTADAPDESCKGKEVPVVDSATCKADSDAMGGMDGMAMGGDATTTDGGTDGMAMEYGTTRKGGEADDDDCKYHVKWLATSAGLNEDVYFQVDVSLKADGKPASHLVVSETPVTAEVLVDNGDPLKNHAAPNSGQTSQETAVPGRYVVGPIHFDQAARWTVRFHFYGSCDDGETSPHGHVAFFFDAK